MVGVPMIRSSNRIDRRRRESWSIMHGNQIHDLLIEGKRPATSNPILNRIEAALRTAAILKESSRDR